MKPALCKIRLCKAPVWHILRKYGFFITCQQRQNGGKNSLKKGMYFLPFTLFSCLGVFLYGMGIHAGAETYIIISLLLISGILLAREKWWGGFFGIFSGASFVYTYFDNMINHLGYTNLITGIFLVLFYSVCAAQVFAASQKASGCKRHPRE